MARKFRRQSFASCSKGRSIACACRKTCLSAGKTEHCAVGFMVDVPFGLHRVPREQPWKVEVGCGLVAALILTAVGGLIGAMEHIHPSTGKNACQFGRRMKLLLRRPAHVDRGR